MPLLEVALSSLSCLYQLFLSFDGAFVGIGVGLLALKSFSQSRFHFAAAKKICRAPSIPLSNLRSRFPDGRDSELVVVSGRVRPKGEKGKGSSVLVSHLFWDSKAVVVERTRTCMYNDAWGILDWIFGLRQRFSCLKKQYQSKTVKTIPFVLTEGGIWPIQAHVVVNLDKSEHDLPLTTVHHYLQPVQPSLSTFLQAVTTNQCPLGILDEERILSVDKMITAVGICSLQDGIPEIRPSEEIPCFLSERSKLGILIYLAVEGEILFEYSIYLGIISLSILGYSAWRNWIRWKAWRRWRQEHEAWISEEAGESDEAESEVPDGRLCVICQRRRRRCAFIPCGHLVCCTRCALLVEMDANPLCSICRQAIHSSVRVYEP